jgi:hypothetical protein
VLYSCVQQYVLHVRPMYVADFTTNEDTRAGEIS